MIKKLLAEGDRKTVIILLATPVLLTIYKYYGLPAFYDRNLAPFFSGSFLSGFYRDFFNFLLTFILLMLIPVLIIKLIFKEKLSDYGFKQGDLKFGLWSMVIILPLATLAVWLSSRQADFQQEYSAFKANTFSLQAFLVYAGAFFIYYIAFEFFFRGFMLQGLRTSLGDLNSLLIQTIPCCLVHLGKPVNEILASIVASLVFGYLVLRTRSLWYVIVMHWLIGVLLNLFIALS
jgi:membrane protease YdiL (CAAX protease family)